MPTRRLHLRLHPFLLTGDGRAIEAAAACFVEGFRRPGLPAQRATGLQLRDGSHGGARLFPRPVSFRTGDLQHATVFSAKTVHPQLRHACGFALANRGHDTRSLQAFGASVHPAHGALHRVVV
jgi:hypothetical protein